MDPQVTVIVPLFNKGPYIKRALDSIARQTFDRFEVLIIDDGSIDDGASIAEAYPDPRVSVIRQVNQGPGGARNRGLSVARGEFVAFLDADDEWLPNYLSHAVDRLSTSGEAACACGYLEGPEGSSTEKLWRRRKLVEGTFRVTADTSPALFLHSVAYLTPCTTVARTEVVRECGGFFENHCTYGEDAFLWLKVLLQYPVGITLKPRVLVHREASALSKNLRGPRPLEPFLQSPSGIRSVCPPELRPLLASFLSIRAFKTACVWGAWGRRRDARMLRNKFRSQNDSRLPFFWPSYICTTPLASALKLLIRSR